MPPEGQFIVCSRGGGRRRARELCAYCGRPVADVLCDAIVDPETKQTCDRSMCSACVAVSRGRLDFCREHVPAAVGTESRLAAG